MKTEAQQKAKRKYLAKGKRLTLDFYPTEADLIEHIEKQPKKQTYIKELIRKDMTAHGCWVQPSSMCNPKCSVCGKYSNYDEKTPYCQYCGAKMDI